MNPGENGGNSDSLESRASVHVSLGWVAMVNLWGN